MPDTFFANGIHVSFDPIAQERLDATATMVGSCIGYEPGGWTAKACDDEELAEDLKAHDLWRVCADELGAEYLSEELSDTEWQHWRDTLASRDQRRVRILIADPIDGSSEWNRAGWRHSPLTTAAMAIETTLPDASDNVVCAAAVGALWQERTWSIWGDELSMTDWYEPSVKETVRIADAKRRLRTSETMAAAYFPTARHARIVAPLYDVVPYLHNLGGIPFSLRVVAGQSRRSYGASIEPLPAAPWELVGLVLAAIGGAAVARLDGAPISLNPFIRQTSIVAANHRVLTDLSTAIVCRTDGVEVQHVAPLRQLDSSVPQR